MHFEELAVVEGVTDMRQPAGEEDLDALVGIADAGMDRAEMVPVLGDIAGLLPQLALGGEQDLLTRMDLAGLITKTLLTDQKKTSSLALLPKLQ